MHRRLLLDNNTLTLEAALLLTETTFEYSILCIGVIITRGWIWVGHVKVRLGNPNAAVGRGFIPCTRSVSP